MIFQNVGMVKWNCHFPFRKSIQVQNMNGDGNMFSQQGIFQQIPEQGCEGGIIYMKVCYIEL